MTQSPGPIIGGNHGGNHLKLAYYRWEPFKFGLLYVGKHLNLIYHRWETILTGPIYLTFSTREELFETGLFIAYIQHRDGIYLTVLSLSFEFYFRCSDTFYICNQTEMYFAHRDGIYLTGAQKPALWCSHQLRGNLSTTSPGFSF